MITKKKYQLITESLVNWLKKVGNSQKYLKWVETAKIAMIPESRLFFVNICSFEHFPSTENVD